MNEIFKSRTISIYKAGRSVYINYNNDFALHFKWLECIFHNNRLRMLDSTTLCVYAGKRIRFAFVGLRPWQWEWNETDRLVRPDWPGQTQRFATTARGQKSRKLKGFSFRPFILVVFPPPLIFSPSPSS